MQVQHFYEHVLTHVPTLYATKAKINFPMFSRINEVTPLGVHNFFSTCQALMSTTWYYIIISLLVEQKQVSSNQPQTICQKSLFRNRYDHLSLLRNTTNHVIWGTSSAVKYLKLFRKILTLLNRLSIHPQGKNCQKMCSKKNQSTPRPSEHPPVMGGKMSKRCCFSHSAYWPPTRKNYTLHVANPARGLLNRERRTKEKVWKRTPPKLLVRT